MQVVIDIPDKYLFRWDNLRQELKYPDMNSFILKALGIGIRTIEQAIKVMDTNEENVIQFDKNYYWDK